MASLKRDLGLPDIFAVAAGAMVSSGLFILPAIAFAKAGPAVVLSYLLAAIFMVPTVFSQAELATAMPRAGGTYFFVERSLGSIWGLFGGLAGWFSLALKSAFAVVGMAVLIEAALPIILPLQLHPWHVKAIAVLCCLVFAAMNLVSVKHTGRLQLLLVLALLGLLALFSLWGAGSVDVARYAGLRDVGWPRVLSTAGLVFISFAGLTKVASVAEEVKSPGRNLPLGMMLSWFVVSVFYLAVVTVTVGVVDGSELAASSLPISLAASKFMGSAGYALLLLAAIAAFVTTANGGILAASRSPMAMSRDGLLPPRLARVNHRFKTPHVSIVVTGAFMVAAILLLDLEKLVKTASTLQLILFIMVNVSVIMMREGRIQSYRPKFRSPLYPYAHIFAIIAYSFLIVDMGKIPLMISVGFVSLSAVWFRLYVRGRAGRASAVMHVVERVTDKELKTVTLENELRDILLERDEIIEDRFDHLIRGCEILDIQGERDAEEVFRDVSAILARRMGLEESVLFEKFLRREAESGTVVQPGFAIPHIVVEGDGKFDILLVRAIDGIRFPHSPDPVKTMFVLAGSRDERNYHLRALMAIAQIAQESEFEGRWLAARDTEAIRNLILLSTRKRDTEQA